MTRFLDLVIVLLLLPATGMGCKKGAAEECPLFDAAALDQLVIEAGAPASGAVETDYKDETDHTMITGESADRFTRLTAYTKPGNFFVDVIEGGQEPDGTKESSVSVQCASNALDLTPCPSLSKLQAKPRSKSRPGSSMASVFPITNAEATACRKALESSRLRR